MEAFGMRLITLFMVAFTAVSASAPAQVPAGVPRGRVSAVAGPGQTWDDEGSIGRGTAAGGRVEWRLFGNTGIEGAVDVLTHDRRGFFNSTGHSTLLSASFVHRFGRAALQPYVLEGLDVVRHSGSTRSGDLVTDSRSVDTGFHFGGGLSIRIGRRFEVGPEGRFYIIRAGDDSDPAWANWIGGRIGMRF
jgi:hypothetical protein